MDDLFSSTSTDGHECEVEIILYDEGTKNFH